MVFFSQRSRVGILYKGEAKARAFLQLQDVRTWGDETHTSTDASADKFDLHQGYLDLIPNENWTFRIGRQEIAYDDDRLLGTGNWNQSGRSHDAVRVMWQSGKSAIHAAWAHNERGEPLSWSPYLNNPNYQDLAFLRAATVCDRGNANLLFIFDSYDPQFPDATGAANAYRWTGGMYSKGQVAGVELRGEGYYQAGRREVTIQNFPLRRVFDIRAFMVGLSAMRDFGVIGTTLWYDYLSRDDELTRNQFESFDPMYGTFHKYYGWVDYFISFPADTRGLGLQDLALKFTADGPSIATTQMDFHYFWLAETSAELGIDDRHLGFEADLMITIPLLKTLSLSGGASLVLPTKSMRTLKGNADQGHWVWTMLDFNVK